ncbi:hypothetical protein [Entomospira culicis]|uniref:Uncharacterized protein n=1 Tax=Entomospira culicis TaxID=2719989 RepID=A0A968KUU9_9SPIO|nr:hypothetical protein [Entomospira culicis]NIZ19595.1 hypothetical protein [Entomospira culicis]NIZ69500.1 hypothetical protein [Entomospira culicis]WDI36615.1 hypothetical protein PVA46_04630 [Entomospira culicis]WDI38243.1 hypothetical protein PVA47_04640 [Entomospira culicis]
MRPKHLDAKQQSDFKQVLIPLFLIAPLAILVPSITFAWIGFSDASASRFFIYMSIFFFLFMTILMLRLSIPRYRSIMSLHRKARIKIEGEKRKVTLTRLASDLYLVREELGGRYWLQYSHDLFDAKEFALHDIQLKLAGQWQTFLFDRSLQIRPRHKGMGISQLTAFAPISLEQVQALAKEKHLAVAHPTLTPASMQFYAKKDPFLLPRTRYFKTKMYANVALVVAIFLFILMKFSYIANSKLLFLPGLSLLIAWGRKADKRKKIMAKITDHRELGADAKRMRLTILTDDITLLQSKSRAWLLFSLPVLARGEMLSSPLLIGVDGVQMHLIAKQQGFHPQEKDQRQEVHLDLLYALNNEQAHALQRAKTITITYPEAYWPYAVERLAEETWQKRRAYLA